MEIINVLKRDEVEFWEEQIREGFDYRKNYGEYSDWILNRKHFRHHFNPLKGLPKGVQQYNYNLIRSLGSALIPSVYLRNPYINITPTYKVNLGPTESFERQIGAKVIEALDNWYIKEIDLKTEARRVLVDHYLCGVGILKSGYDGKFGFRPEQMDALGGTGDLWSKKKQNERIEYSAKIRGGMPWTLRVMPDYVIVPFGCSSIDDAEWIDHIVFRKLEDVLEDSRYPNAKKLISGGTHSALGDANVLPEIRSNMPNANRNRWVEIHEVRDTKTGTIRVFIPGIKEWLRPPEEDVLQIEGLPFDVYNIIEDPEYFWSTPDASIIQDQQREMIEARTQTILHRRIALLKFLYDKNKLTTIELDKLLNGEIGAGIGIDGSTEGSVIPLQTHIAPDLIAWVQEIRSDARELLGQGRNQLGEFEGSGRRSATEASIIQQGYSLRINDRQDAVASLVCRSIRKANQMFQLFWSEEKTAMVVGMEGMKYWVRFKMSDIRGEFDENVDVESLVPINKGQKKQDLLQMMQIFSRNPGADVNSLMKAFAREYNYMDVLSIFPEAPETQSQPMDMKQFVQQQNGLRTNSKAMGAKRQGAVNQMLLS